MTESPQPAASPAPAGESRDVTDDTSAANSDVPTADVPVGEESTADGITADEITADEIGADQIGADEVVLPDEEAAERTRERLARLAVPGSGLGALTDVVAWAAAVRGQAAPAPFRVVRTVVLADGAAGDAAADPTTGTPIGILADRAGTAVQVVTATSGAPVGIDDRDALTAEEARLAMGQGRDLADRAADEGTDLLVLCATDPDAEVAAAAVVAAMTGTEFPTLLARVQSADGHIDDAAWMRHCALVRDALRRTRQRRRDARELVAALGGHTLAAATGLLLRAAARRTPILLDGPVGVTAALLARDIAPQVPRWCRLADLGNHPTVRYVADILDLVPLVDLRLGLSEGAAALTALPLFQAGLALAADLPVRPAPLPPAPEPSAADPVDDTAGGDGTTGT